jgi:hypothetical protein
MVRHAMSRTEATMTKRDANQQQSLAALLAKKLEDGAVSCTRS